MTHKFNQAKCLKLMLEREGKTYLQKSAELTHYLILIEGSADFNIYKFQKISAVQAEIENVVIKPTRPAKSVTKTMDLDYEVSGPAPFTHVDIKTPVGSKILRKQSQSTTLEEMSYNKLYI